MKALLSILAIGFAFNAMAEESSSRGYLVKGRHDSLSYTGLTDAGVDVGFDLEWAAEHDNLNTTFIKTMFACMKKKETHAIQVVTTTFKTKGVTAEGQIIDSHGSKIVSVGCVKAPGFLQHWRSTFNMGE